MGGEVQPGNQREFGYAQVKTIDSELTRDIYDDAPNTLDVWMSHGDKVSKLPNGFAVIGDTPSCPIAMIENVEKQFYGIQFHPEVTHTKQGRALLNRFVLDICGAQPSWTMPNYIEEAVAKIREQVGSDEVILGLSGGVDSSVAAALIHRAIGDQLTCVFVDHGLLRLNEGKMVMDMFARNLGVKVIHVDAEEQFMAKLAGVTDPEKKRKIIGAEFIEVFDTEEKKLTNAKWLAQGTIYPDVIETGSGKTAEKGKRISVHYSGYLTDGSKFDSSLDRGQPLTIILGVGQVIRGWDEGFGGMREGGKRKFTIPPEMGYGARGAGGVIPPNATLVFEVELLKVHD